MANVLGELFGDIATAIREKTGDTATMKPAQFPEKIGAIKVAAEPVIQALEVTENGTYTPAEGVDGYSPVTVNVLGSGGTLVGATGSFTATGTTQTITHGLGTVPLFVYFYPTTGLAGTAAKGCAFFGFGCNQEIMDVLGTSTDAQYYLKCINVASNNYQYEFEQGTPDATIETTLDRVVSNATETTVRLGSSSQCLSSGKSYTWVAVGYKTAT